LIYRGGALLTKRHLLQRFDGRDSMAILDAGNIATKQARTLFNVALGELFGLAHFAEAVSNNHAGIVALRLLEGKPGVFGAVGQVENGRIRPP